MTDLTWENRMQDRREAAADELKAQERAMSPDRYDIWNAVQDWTLYLIQKEYPLYPCGHDVVEGEAECSECQEEAELRAQQEREQARNYRGPCVGKEDW